MTVVSTIRELREHGIDLEDWLGVDTVLIGLWEEERAFPTRLQRRRLEWLLQQAENDRLLAQASLPRCSVHDGFEQDVAALARDREPTVAELETAAKGLLAHINSCVTCSANREWERRNLRPPGNFPIPGIQGLFNAVAVRVPGQLLPAVFGALFLGVVVTMNATFGIIVLLLRNPSVPALIALIGEALPAILAATAAGAAGGLVIPIVRPLLRTMGAFGDYLTGILIVEAYMAALALLAPVAFGETLVTSSADWIMFLGIGAFFGIVGAFAYRRAEKRRVAVSAA